MLQIGPHKIANPVLLAPMAGITDRPFRQICREMGAGLATSEMLISDVSFWKTRKSSWRMDCANETGIRSVQLAGADAAMMAQAAEFLADQGVDIIDINMGCPAKKVCNRAAGSALMREPDVIKGILGAVVKAVNIPVTLKMRTGWCQNSRNGADIAAMAEDIGIQALTVHGRTRADAYKGEAEYATLAQIRQRITIPLIANGDITSPQKAADVLRITGADAVMIGREAQGNPWIFKSVSAFLKQGNSVKKPEKQEVGEIMLRHLHDIHHFYGEEMGVRISRKHMGWYVKYDQHGIEFRQQYNQLTSAQAQVQAVINFLSGQFA